jgi:hypothetical protein
MLLLDLFAKVVSPLNVFLDVYFERECLKLQLKQIKEDELNPNELWIHVQMLLQQGND